LKAFFKDLSIYGLVPVFGKFISILLLPLYTRLLSSEDYGAQDVLVQLAIFMSFAICLELYSGIGRYYYTKGDNLEKARLVSSGLWFTVFNALIICSLVLLFKERIYSLFFTGTEYRIAFSLALLWAPISAVYTYLLVMMRFEKRAKLYLVLVNIQLLIRILSTIGLVAIFRLGVTGIILGHVLAEISAVVMFLVVLRKRMTFVFEYSDIRQSLRFSLPLVPAVLAIAFEKPLVRYLVSYNLSLSDLGIFTIALQISMLLSFLHSGLSMVWQPYLYDMLNKKGYETEINRIYSVLLGFSGLICSLVILNSRLILNILTQPEYYPAVGIIGFISIKSVIEILRTVAGCGPMIAKRTELNMYYEIAASAVTVIGFLAFKDRFGIAGLAIAMLCGAVLKFVWSSILTARLTKIRINHVKTAIYVAILLFIAILVRKHPTPYEVSIIFSIILAILYTFSIRQQLRIVKDLMIKKPSH